MKKLELLNLIKHLSDEQEIDIVVYCTTYPKGRIIKIQNLETRDNGNQKTYLTCHLSNKAL